MNYFIFIIWQDSLKVNPNVLIGSFLVGILPYGPFPWKRSYAVYFLFSKAAKFKLRKENVYYSHLRKKLPKKIDILRTRNTNIHEANFIILKI